MIEHVRKAAEALVAGRGAIKERLHAAASELAVVGLELGRLPTDLREEAESINAELSSSIPGGGGGATGAALNQMSEEDASRLALRILHLYVRYSRYSLDS